MSAAGRIRFLYRHRDPRLWFTSTVIRVVQAGAICTVRAGARLMAAEMHCMGLMAWVGRAKVTGAFRHTKKGYHKIADEIQIPR